MGRGLQGDPAPRHLPWRGPQEGNPGHIQGPRCPGGAEDLAPPPQTAVHWGPGCPGGGGGLVSHLCTLQGHLPPRGAHGGCLDSSALTQGSLFWTLGRGTHPGPPPLPSLLLFRGGRPNTSTTADPAVGTDRPTSIPPPLLRSLPPSGDKCPAPPASVPLFPGLCHCSAQRPGRWAGSPSALDPTQPLSFGGKFPMKEGWGASALPPR